MCEPDGVDRIDFRACAALVEFVDLRRVSIYFKILTSLTDQLKSMQSLQTPPAWRLQDAKAQFSSVVEFALRGVPQHVTRRGKKAVVVLSEQDFITLQRNAQATAPGFVTHLLAMPKPPASAKGKAKLKGLSPERVNLALRDVDLS
jgi:antitoxin Phd